MKKWIIYEITTQKTPIHGVMFRGRLRKLGLENNIDILSENASDKENCVRFALLDEKHLSLFEDYIIEVIEDSKIEKILENVVNPVLSKMKVNKEERYKLR